MCSTPEGIGGGISLGLASSAVTDECAQRPKASEGESEVLSGTAGHPNTCAQRPKASEGESGAGYPSVNPAATGAQRPKASEGESVD